MTSRNVTTNSNTVVTLSSAASLVTNRYGVKSLKLMSSESSDWYYREVRLIKEISFVAHVNALCFGLVL